MRVIRSIKSLKISYMDLYFPRIADICGGGVLDKIEFKADNFTDILNRVRLFPPHHILVLELGLDWREVFTVY